MEDFDVLNCGIRALEDVYYLISIITVQSDGIERMNFLMAICLFKFEQNQQVYKL